MARREKKKADSTPLDETFKDFIVYDQLADCDVEWRKMFGGYGLYHEGKMFGIIARDRLYFKTNEDTQTRYLAAGMPYFKPSSTQSLKSYLEVPGNVLESRRGLIERTREAWLLAK